MIECKKAQLKRTARCGLLLLPFVTFIIFVFLLAPQVVSAQDDDDLAPPPLKLLAKEDRAHLENETEIKVKTKLAVDMMRSHVDAAEKLNTANDFNGVFRELGFFRALVDYTLAFLEKQDMHENRSLDNYKRLELSLRAVTPRIEAIRRELPVQYEEYVRKLLIHIRDARSKASEPMFSDTVLPKEKQNEK